MKKAFIFPGQGSQFVGMGKEMAENFSSARYLFQEVDESLHQNLSDLIFNGPIEELTLTSNAQPALMAVSLAIVRALESECGFNLNAHGSFVAGHSLGEYSALAAVGALTVADTAKLLRIRGDAMQSAVPVGLGAMAALLGADFDLAEIIAKEASQDGICQIANDNSPGQIILSGATKAVDKAVSIATEKYSKKIIKLLVSAPFHSQMMLEAQEVMRDALALSDIKTPSIDVVMNVTAKSTRDIEEIRELLVKQVTSMVRWRESILYLKEQNIEQIIEIGAGKVLTGLNKRIDKDIISFSIQAPSDIDAIMSNL